MKTNKHAVKRNNSSVFNNSANPKTNKIKVQNFADLQGEATHRRFDEMIDETIYFTALENMKSDQYGDGYKVHFKELPNAKETFTAACFGQYIVPVLDGLYASTNQGENITEQNPVKVIIRKAGKSYRFE